MIYLPMIIVLHAVCNWVIFLSLFRSDLLQSNLYLVLATLNIFLLTSSLFKGRRQFNTRYACAIIDTKYFFKMKNST